MKIIGPVTVDVEDGQTYAYAEIEGVGLTAWAIAPRSTTAGVYVWGPAGDSPACWVDCDVARLVGTAAAIRLGDEVLARVPRVPA